MNHFLELLHAEVAGEQPRQVLGHQRERLQGLIPGPEALAEDLAVLGNVCRQQV